MTRIEKLIKLQENLVESLNKINVKLEKICTMKSSIDLCKLPPVRYGSFKFPKLEELHHHLFGCSFDGAHDALEDVRATARCFFEMKKLGIEFKY